MKDYRTPGITRRGLIAGAAAAGAAAPANAGAAEVGVESNIYESIGVRTLINARGTITIITGSQTLPEVKAAMDQASRRFVQMDELMEAVGKRLSDLTGAEWGMVTSGAAGALAVATCACVAGADPDKMELLSYRMPAQGLKYDVIIPHTSRNVYDHSIRSIGINVLEPRTREEFESTLGPNTAMVMLLSAAKDFESGPMSLESVVALAHKHGIPVLVDAAAEILTFPNVHLERGADLVVYSGGKCIRGPQSAGLLLGRKDLVKAAWINSAPHHSVCRGLKTGKEEIMGMLAAVEAWKKTDHGAKERLWADRLKAIASRLEPVAGLQIELRPAHGIDNRTPLLEIQWNPAQIDLTEDELEQILWDGEPRIAIGGKGSFLPFPPNTSHSASVNPSMLMPGEEKIVADRLYHAFSSAPKPGSRPQPQAPVANLSGLWDVRLQFVSGIAEHSLSIEQTGSDLSGIHHGQAASRELRGTLEGNRVVMRSSYTQHGARLNFTFRGTADHDHMEGVVAVGEYGEARWTAKRHTSQFPGGGKPAAS